MADDTYLNWYKQRMGQVVSPGAWSLMSSSISEPWEMLKSLHVSPSDPVFERRYQTPNPYGLPDLIARIGRQYGVPETNVLVCQGATGGIYLVARSFLNPGDRVLVESPGYEPLWLSPRLCGAAVDRLPRPAGHVPTPQEVSERMTPKTRLIIVTNMHNPTGKEMSREAIRNIVSAARSVTPDVRVVVDEIYLDFNPRRESASWDLDSAIVSVSSLTKVYGLSILRCGWIFAATDVLRTLRDNQVLVSGIGSRYLETLSTLVFDNLDACRSRSLSILNRNRPLLKRAVQPLLEKGVLEGEIPEYGCISFFRVPGVENTQVLTDYLERKYRVYCVPGRFFDAPDHIRIGIGALTPARLKEALQRFVDGVTAFRSSDRSAAPFQ